MQTRRRFAAIAVLVAAPSFAWGQTAPPVTTNEPPPSPPPAQSSVPPVVVTTAPAPPAQSAAPPVPIPQSTSPPVVMAAPPPGAPPAHVARPGADWWEATLTAYEVRIAELKVALRGAEDRGDRSTALQIRGELTRTKRALSDFREETMEHNSPALMAGGIALAGLGLTGAVVTAVLVATAHADADADEARMPVAAVATAAGAVACIGAGVPMIIVGARRVRTDDMQASVAVTATF